MKRASILVLVLILAAAGWQPAVAAPVAQSSDLPPAPLTNDEGGPLRLVGGIDYTDFSIPDSLTDPSPVLLDMVHVVQHDLTQFAPIESQILGHMTSPVAPPPLGYAFDLPVEPTATYLDVDNDGEEDTGVQIFRLAMGANVNDGSHLEQLDQWADLNSYLNDPISGQITNGSLLVYAPDDAQGFPNGFGDDGILFTEDDPAVGLPQGYTVVHFGPAGFSFDRSAEAELNVLEKPAAASVDFSDQGILESYNNLLDHLSARYSFTELRGLDWDAIRAEYLPRVEEAEALAAEDPNRAGAIFALALHQLAQSIRDAHVMAVITDATFTAEAIMEYGLELQPIATNVGANTLELSDGRIIVTEVIPGSPAAEAGWTLGTEIVAVDGTPVDKRIPTVVYNNHTGTDAGQRLFQVNNLLKFPAAEGEGPAADVTIDAILAEGGEAERFTMTPAAYPLPDRQARIPKPMPISYRMLPAAGYLTWEAFQSPEVHIAVLEEFLATINAPTSGVQGIILDLRGNSGGWDVLYFTMASYFFNADNPVSMDWIEQDVYDPAQEAFVRDSGPEYLLSAPQAELYYGGPIVILVDQNCASSCEFFSQFLQTNGRATVIGQYPTEGAGAPIDRIAMPGGITFQYTKARAYFSGTDELNLEAKGVTLDEQVPITVESLQAAQAGGDPVLDAGLTVLANLAAQAYVDAITLVPLPDEAGASYAAVYPEGWTPAVQDTVISFTAPDQQHAIGFNQSTNDVAALLAPVGITDPDAALLETYTANDLEWSIYGAVDANNFGYRSAVTTVGDTNYVITLAVPNAAADALTDGLLYPLIDAFIPGEGS